MTKTFVVFTTPTCPNCPPLKRYMESVQVQGEFIDASQPSGLEKAGRFSVTSVPTIILFDDGKETGRAHTVEDAKRLCE